jgi:hypothetical protein
MYTTMYDGCAIHGLNTILEMQKLLGMTAQHDAAKIDEERQKLLEWARGAQANMATILNKVGMTIKYFARG